ncbi:hypothetical protein Trydic_g8717 [Trypoxylus dichotomus]
MSACFISNCKVYIRAEDVIYSLDELSAATVRRYRTSRRIKLVFFWISNVQCLKPTAADLNNTGSYCLLMKI